MKMLIQTFLIFVLCVHTASSENECVNSDPTQLCIVVVCSAVDMKLTVTKQPDSDGNIISAIKHVTVGDCDYDFPDAEIEITEVFATSQCITTKDETTQQVYSAEVWAKIVADLVTGSDSGVIANCVKPKDGYITSITTAEIQTKSKQTDSGGTTDDEDPVVYIPDVIPPEITIDVADSNGVKDSETIDDTTDDEDTRVNEKVIGEDIDIYFNLNDAAKAAGFNDITLKTISVKGGTASARKIILVEDDCESNSKSAQEIVKNYERSVGERTLKTIAISIAEANQMVYEGTLVLWQTERTAVDCSSRKKRQAEDTGYVVPFQKAMNVSITDVKSDGTKIGGDSSSQEGGCDETETTMYLQLIVGMATINGMNLITSLYFGIVLSTSR